MRKLALILFLAVPAYAGNLTNFWVSGGGDKIARQDFYPLGIASNTITSNWDGHTAKAKALKNETISFVAYMLAGESDATSVNVVVSSLTGPSGNGVASVVVSSGNVFDWNGRPIEVFYVRYLRIAGLSKLGADPSEYEARHQSVPFRRPCTVNGNDQCVPNGGTGWTDRPYHDMFLPDILVPYEAIAASSFTVAASSSQAIWIDYYFGKTLSTGTYTGTITIREGIDVSTVIPVSVTLRNGTLPDTHTMKSFGALSAVDSAYRHHGEKWPNSYTVEPYYTTSKRYMQMLYRHGIIGMHDDTLANDTPNAITFNSMKGTLYSAATGYANASGQDTGSKVVSFGTYGSWQGSWSGATTSAETLCGHISNLQTYMINNSLTDVRSFLYLTDETLAGGDVEKWAWWMASTESCQNENYKIWPWITYSWADVYDDAPHVGMPATTSYMGVSSTTWESRADYYITTASTQGWNYNGSSPFTALVFNHEGEGWEPREIAWGNFKHGAPRVGQAIPHFLWMTNYYNDSNDSDVETNVWKNSKTFGYYSKLIKVLSKDGLDTATVYISTSPDGSAPYSTADDGWTKTTAITVATSISTALNSFGHISSTNVVDGTPTDTLYVSCNVTGGDCEDFTGWVVGTSSITVGENSNFGKTGYQYNNGDGVFVYPGTDLSYPENNYGLDGPIASWRMKMYRRGIQDADIMAQAYAISESSTMAIVNEVVPKVLWEYNCYSLLDCSYGYGERGFAMTADAYESARESLIEIIDENGGSPSEYCGDSSCNGDETCSTCPGDCGACASSGGNGKTFKSNFNFYGGTLR